MKFNRLVIIDEHCHCYAISVCFQVKLVEESGTYYVFAVSGKLNEDLLSVLLCSRTPTVSNLASAVGTLAGDDTNALSQVGRIPWSRRREAVVD